MQAFGRGLLTAAQCDVLYLLGDNKVAPREFFDMVLTFGIATERVALETLIAEALELSVEAVPDEPDKPITELAERGSKSEVLAVEWFCFYAMLQGALTQDACLGLASDLGGCSDVLTFAQAALDVGLCDNQLQIQILTDTAKERAGTGNAPPKCLFMETSGPAIDAAARDIAQVAPPAPKAQVPAPARPDPGQAVPRAAFAGDPGLQEVHPEVPLLSKAELYDRVTRLYLELFDEKKIAASLSKSFGVEISGRQVKAFRVEAAAAAERMDSEEQRRRWIYRYRNVTVNNLVKEYMSITGAHELLASKRELAEEIDELSREIPENRLLMAVNEALGRNNIDREFVKAMLSYCATARELEPLVVGYAKAQAMTSEEAYFDLATKVGGLGVGGETARLGFLARTLGCSAGHLAARHIAFLLEYRRTVRGPKQGATFIERLMHGADLLGGRPT